MKPDCFYYSDQTVHSIEQIESVQNGYSVHSRYSMKITPHQC